MCNHYSVILIKPVLPGRGLTSKFRSKMQNNITQCLLNAPHQTHVGSDEFRCVGLLPVQFRVNQQKLHHMYNIITEHSLPACVHGKSKVYFYTGVILWKLLVLLVCFC